MLNEKSVTTRKRFVPLIIALIGTIMMVAAIFLPYATATETHAEALKKYQDEVIYKDFDMSAKDIMNISMVEYAVVYSNLSEQFWGDSAPGMIYVAFVVLIGGGSLFAVLVTVLKKPIAALIFDVLAFGVFALQNWDHAERGVIPSSSYDWGAAYYIFYIAAGMAFAGSVWMLATKIQANRKSKAAERIL